MQLFEADAKELLKECGLPVPTGFRAKDVEQLCEYFRGMKPPAMLKAQFPFGGRGLAGFIRKVSDEQQLRDGVNGMQSKTLNGLSPKEFLLEPVSEFTNELYVGEFIDAALNRKVMLLGSEGGVAVEQSRSVRRIVIDPYLGLLPGQVRLAVRELALAETLAKPLFEFLMGLDRAFEHYDARLLEINPLVVLADATLQCLDVHFIADDGAAPRQPLVLDKLRQSEPRHDGDLLHMEHSLAYVGLDGDIGLISGGAGMTMACMDLLDEYGGRAACFLDASANPTKRGYGCALQLLESNPTVRSIFVSIHGGATLMDKVAENFVDLLAETPPRKPVTIRLAGTHEEEAAALLRRAGIRSFTSFEEAAKAAIQSARCQ